jgi:hypothetical protein
VEGGVGAADRELREYRGLLLASLTRVATIGRMAEEHAQPLEQQLEEIGSRLAWVRDYL